MRKPLTKSPPPLGSIHRDEVLPVREAARRLGWQRKAITEAQKNGLRVCRCGRYTITTGQAIFDYVEKMMRANGEGGE
ncbi:MAG: hypothetical protein IT426_18200 [Pirellulales bacterium]|nr:hypothetical protein [Pirellulales bacterium]